MREEIAAYKQQGFQILCVVYGTIQTFWGHARLSPTIQQTSLLLPIPDKARRRAKHVRSGRAADETSAGQAGLLRARRKKRGRTASTLRTTTRGAREKKVNHGHVH